MILSCIFFIFLSLSSKVSCQFSLSSTPSTLEGVELCQGVNVQLYCELNAISARVFNWFLCDNDEEHDECTVYAQATPVVNGEGAVTVYNPIAGLDVTIEIAVQSGQGAISVVSIMSFDLSVYDREQVRTFRCGRVNNPEPWSSAITIDITILSVMPPIPIKLIATYNTSYELSELAVTWRQDQRCFFEYTYKIYLITSHTNMASEEISVQQRTVTAYEACSFVTEVCYASLKLRNNAHPSYSVRLVTNESFSNMPIYTYNFLDTIYSSILDRLSYSIPFTLCEAQFSCSHDYNSRDCTIELTEDQTSDTILPSATEAVCIPPFTVYSFLITVDVSDSLDIQVAGNINSTQACADECVSLGECLGNNVAQCCNYITESCVTAPQVLCSGSECMFDCNMTDLIDPEFGLATVDSTLFGSVVSYTCDSGYTLVGDSMRTCTLSGWSGTNPVCSNLISDELGSNAPTHSLLLLLMLLMIICPIILCIN